MVSNFDFLKKDFPVLSNFGKMAEKYCYSDSNSCLMKLGMIGETIVNLMFTYDRIAFPHDNTAVARIDTLSREGLLTSDLVTILHGLRKVRNKAVHENYASIADDKIFLPMLSSSIMYNALSSLAVGSTVKNLKSDSVKSLLVPIPPLAEQACISRQIENYFATMLPIERSLS